MTEFPQIPPIPPGWKIPPYFSTTSLFEIYEKALEGEGRTSTEIAAIKLGMEAIFFLVGLQPPPGSDYIAALETTPPKIQVFTWISRTKPLLDYLDAYLAEVRHNGTPEQIQFLHDTLEKPSHEDDEASQQCSAAADADDDESVNDAKVDSFPEPSEAIAILGRVAQGYASTSVEYLGLQITIRALRYLIDSGEAPEFMRYVDQMSKWVPLESE